MFSSTWRAAISSSWMEQPLGTWGKPYWISFLITTWLFPREALIKSLFAFILEILCNARNGLTRIASYLRKPMTKQCIKILIKENSMN